MKLIKLLASVPAGGLIFGLLPSLAGTPVITKAYAPILVPGAIGGLVIAFIVDK